ncbi:MAG: tRNA lysidine(34) synthetase TilS [Parvibaculum sp.]|nr:tRNA lysidine(34) synthetase TilS [Parvibaculum sp.]
MPRIDASLTAADFASRLKALHVGPRIAVAFSGGSDSLALLVLAAQWAMKSKTRFVIAYTVDHGLRQEAAAEARQCAKIAKSLGVTHRTVRWKGDKPLSGIQAAARDARYALLTEACARDNIQCLLTAHHLDDQAETFILRLARGSGVDGLAAMSDTRQLGRNVRLLRPLLNVSRESLRAIVARAGLTPIEDPSNDNLRFDRVKARRLMADLAALGLTAERLAATTSNMARARHALEDATQRLLFASSALHEAGTIDTDAEALLDAPDDIGLRALAEILKSVGGTDYAPRLEALTAVYDALYTGALAKARTLNGCRLVLTRGRLIAMRETSAALSAQPVTLSPNATALWDGRFTVALGPGAKSKTAYEVRALGPEGLKTIRECKLTEPQIPKSALPTLPALWQGKRLVAAPHVAFQDGPVRFSAVFAPRGAFAFP